MSLKVRILWETHLPQGHKAGLSYRDSSLVWHPCFMTKFCCRNTILSPLMLNKNQLVWTCVSWSWSRDKVAQIFYVVSLLQEISIFPKVKSRDQSLSDLLYSTRNTLSRSNMVFTHFFSWNFIEVLGLVECFCPKCWQRCFCHQLGIFWVLIFNVTTNFLSK